MKKSFMLLVVLILSLAVVQPAFAQDNNPPACTTSPCVYVNSARQPTGNEDGSSANPYCTYEEGKAYAQSLPNGGYVYFWDGYQWKKQYIPPAYSGGTGAELPSLTLYIILATVALILIVVGWRLLQRSHSPRTT